MAHGGKGGFTTRAILPNPTIHDDTADTMPKLRQMLRELHRDQSGVTSIEYALLGLLIAVAILFSVTSVGTSVFDLYQKIASAVTA
ncbi:Flp family type IVb pilin [Cupriavidus basilensis]